MLTGHSPVFGVLAEGSLVEIVSEDETRVRAAVSGGFLSVADDQVSILAAQAQLGDEVDAEEARRELDTALSEPGRARRSQPRPSTPGRCCGPQATRPDFGGRSAGA